VTINTVLGIKFVYSKDQIDMSFVWIEVRPGVSKTYLGRARYRYIPNGIHDHVNFVQGSLSHAKTCEYPAN